MLSFASVPSKWLSESSVRCDKKIKHKNMLKRFRRFNCVILVMQSGEYILNLLTSQPVGSVLKYQLQSLNWFRTRCVCLPLLVQWNADKPHWGTRSIQQSEGTAVEVFSRQRWESGTVWQWGPLAGKDFHLTLLTVYWCVYSETWNQGVNDTVCLSRQVLSRPSSRVILSSSILLFYLLIISDLSFRNEQLWRIQ